MEGDLNVLALNAGSSTLKGRLFRIPAGPAPLAPPAPAWSVHVEWGGRQDVATLRVNAEEPEDIPADPSPMIASVLERLPGGPLHAVGHRVVHGGSEYTASMRVTDEVMAAIDRYAPLAPAHNPVELEVIRAVTEAAPEAPQFAAFDTAFHRTLPLAHRIYPLPYALFDDGIQRYGFHGINHRYCAERAAQVLASTDRDVRLVCCHLGNGCSLSAVRGTTCVDTTMGFTPLEGLVMGTRGGSIDPGILIHLARRSGTTIDDLDRMLNQESGLKGLSGISSDMRAVAEAAEAGHDRARLAIDVFVHRLVREIGALTAVLGGLDALIFTGGIGENAAPIRRRVCDHLAFLGVSLDPEGNDHPRGDEDLAHPDSAVRILRIAANEEWAIALDCRGLLAP